ncbi:MAG: tetratricopeptide repeat protein [Betaproteobacteria bacterium]|nr:tetratricopeptide repeat protein [Betaproteobacteria bacterium]
MHESQPPSDYYLAAQRAIDGGDLPGAVEPLRAILGVQGSSPEVHCNLGVALRAAGELDEAAHHLQEAGRLRPTMAAAWYNLGLLEFDRARYAEAERAYRGAITAEPTVDSWQHSLLCLLNYAPGHDQRDVYEAHRVWASRFPAPPDMHTGRARPRDTGRLRVGYVSADFRGHSVAFFIGPVLQHHDRRRFEIFCYDNWAQSDATTARLRGYAEHWRPVHALDDDALERQIREDRIDLLVDLSGHTQGHRLPVFARKPAPVQATWIGYPQTTGLATIDYRITDRYLDPPGEADAYGSEQLWRLPECGFCFMPLDAAPRPGAPPCMASGAVTFGSINHYFKVTDGVVAVWARILAAVPGARLRMIVEHGERPAVVQSVSARFAAHGVAPERVDVRGRTDLAGFFDQLAEIDVALDPFPYNGGTTTHQTLWAGVPVVTLAGNGAMARCSTMILSMVGLPDLAAANEDEYVAIAARLAGDPRRVAELRASLRDRYRASPLYAVERFTRTLEEAYDAMWQSFCDRDLAANQ